MELLRGGRDVVGVRVVDGVGVLLVTVVELAEVGPVALGVRDALALADFCSSLTGAGEGVDELEALSPDPPQPVSASTTATARVAALALIRSPPAPPLSSPSIDASSPNRLPPALRSSSTVLPQSLALDTSSTSSARAAPHRWLIRGNKA